MSAAPSIMETLATVETINGRQRNLLQGARFEIEFLRKTASDLNRLAEVKERRLATATAERSGNSERF